MNNLLIPDPYDSIYEYKGLEDPSFQYGLIPLPRWKVDAVNDLLNRYKGADAVKTEKDWNSVAGLVVFFIQNFPQEWAEFRKTIPDIRETRRSGGYSKSREIRYVASLPFRLERLIKVLFPHQQFDKLFVNKFVKRFKIFQVGGA